MVSDANAQRLNELERELADETDLEVTVELADESTALQALCSGRPVAAWVSAFSFVKAHETCGALPALAITRGTLPRVNTGTSAMIIAPSTETDITTMAGKVFCRSAEHELDITWVLPSLLLASAGINPVTDLAEIKDLPDDIILGMALLEGVCNAAALPPGQFDDFLEDLAERMSTETKPIRVSDLEKRLTVLVESGATVFPADADDWEGYPANVIPYEVLVFAPEASLPASLRSTMSDSLEAFFTDRTSGTARARDLLDADGIIAVDLEDFAAFRELLVNAKWDMTFSE